MSVMSRTANVPPASHEKSPPPAADHDTTTSFTIAPSASYLVLSSTCCTDRAFGAMIRSFSPFTRSAAGSVTVRVTADPDDVPVATATSSPVSVHVEPPSVLL